MQRREPGVRARKTPALNTVYADEALPVAKGLAELALGERKALAAMGVTEHAARVQTRQIRLEKRRSPQKTG